MATDPKPAPQATVTINEQEWPLVDTGKLLWPEVRETKRISGGMGLVDIERGLASADPDAWFAYLYVCIKRSWPTLKEEELEAALGSVPLVDILSTIDREALEVASVDPPAPRLVSDSEEPQKEDGSG